MSIDRSRINVLTSENRKLKTEVSGLKKNNTTLSNKVASLERQVAEIATLRDTAAQATALSNENTSLKRQVSDAQNQIQQLTSKISKLESEARAADNNTELTRKIGTLDEENTSLKRQLADNQSIIKSLESKISVLEARGVSTDETTRKLLAATSENIRLNTETKTLKERLGELEGRVQKVPTPLTAESVPVYFRKVIDSFNKTMKTDESTEVDYVIGGMDVELKTHLLTDKDNNPILSTPTIDNLQLQKDTLSTIKFSIKPVPKAIED